VTLKTDLIFLRSVKIFEGAFMSQHIYDKVRANPKFAELVQKRSSFAWKLAIIMLVVYYAFILVIAFSPSLFAIKIGEGVTTLGIPVGIGVILIAFVLTGIYTQRANGEFDDLTNQIKEELRSAE
jgi:uncharacterized membrane protein (DUF485 family)